MASLAEAADALKLANRDDVPVTSGFNFREDITDNLLQETELLNMSHNTQSEFQLIQVVETAAFGKTLLLDHHTQSSAKDEFVYHESLVHPPMLAVGWAQSQVPGAAPSAKRAFVGGGGELATARELLQHASFEEVVMIDLDKQVVEVSIEHLPSWSAGCVADPRLKLHYEDAYAWMNRSDDATGTFDIIIMDICDPIEAGPGIVLYTKEFYELAKTKLRPGGVFVTQAGPAGLLNHTECYTVIRQTLASVFEHTLPYFAEVPSFGSNWGFVLAFDATGTPGSTLTPAEAKAAGDSFVNMPAAELDGRLSARVPTDRLKFYDGIAHRGMFSLPKYLRAACAAEERVITKATPVYTH